MFSGNFSDMLDKSNGDTKLSFELLANDCKLHMTYLQPQANQVVPSRLNYEYYQIRKFQQSVGKLIEPLDGFEVNYNNITLHEIPKRMYIFAAPKNQQVSLTEKEGVTDLKTQQEANMAQCNFFARVNSLAVNFDSQDGRLSTLDSYDLWKMSSKNGLTKSYKQWEHGVGSVLCIEFGKDMNLNPLLAPGVRGNFQLSLNVKYQDIRDACYSSNPSDLTSEGPKDYTAFLVIVPTGVVTIDNQLITTSIGSVTEENIFEAPWLAAGTRVEYSGMSGGNLKGIFNALSKGIKVASKGVPIIGPVVGNLLSQLDDPRAQMMGQVVKAVSKSMGGRTSGGRRTGGAKVRSNSLARRM
jgi:hypothetical protein